MIASRSFRARPRRPALSTLVALPAVLALAGCGGGSDDDDDLPPPGSNVSLLVPHDRVDDVTGAPELSPSSILQAPASFALIVDAASSSVLELDEDGSFFVFSSRADLLDATGDTTVALGPLDAVRVGVLSGSFLAADAVTGGILRLSPTGVPSLFTTEERITAITGAAGASMSLPRELTNNQFVSQDLVTLDLLRFDASGNPTPFVTGLALAAAAGVPPGPGAEIRGWARGPTSGSLFARFASTANIVRIQANGATVRWVDATALGPAFPDVTSPLVLDMVAATASDTLLLLLGEEDRGVAVAIVTSDGEVSSFASRSGIEAVAGSSVDLSDLVVLPNGIAAAVDRGGSQILTFGTGGSPSVVGRRADIAAAAGAAEPSLSLATGIGSDSVALPELESDAILLVR